eukprot:TRINITY_DN106278_c0_g1_i1.p1 TRINITY_DN106278_c0_g1~~TRINITY_DN106278_c0_g1_i1.p1  ORF type:complete len:660 (-),score=144.65 TRINITY_DN106278_c0_g1_i1:133-2112(-)
MTALDSIVNRPTVLDDLTELSGGTSFREHFEGASSVEPKGKELEVVIADMENRLRNTILRILRPALEQISELDHRMRIISVEVDKQADFAAKVQKLAMDTAQNTEFAQVLQETIGETKEQLRSLDRSTSEQLAEQRFVQATFDKSIQDHKSNLLKLGREDARIWEEAARLQKQSEDEQRAHQDAINTMHRKLTRTKEELEAMINELIRQREELIEDLFGDGKGLNKLTKRCDSLEDFVAPIPHMQKVQIDLGTDLRQCVERQDKQADQHMDFKHVFDDYITKQELNEKDMRDEFKRQSNQLVAHTAQLMKGVRSSYQSEMDQVKELRNAVSKTLQNSDRLCRELEERMIAESRRMDTLHRELAQDIEEIASRRKRDRISLEAEQQQVKNQLSADRESANKTRSTVDYLARLVGLVIESCRIGCALEVQDFADRNCERWLCHPGDSSKAAEPLRALELEKQKVNKEDTSFRENQELLTDFRRGLARSCYRPGQVPFSGHNFDRRDLLILHNRLLLKAQQQFSQGPEQSTQPSTQSALPPKSQSVAQLQKVSLPAKGSQQAASVSEIAMQPGARGGTSAEQGRPSSKGYPAGKGLDEYWPSSCNSPGGRQRPGSQGQPQAIGSRGTASGLLGETEPPLGSESPLRLPAIATGGRNGSITVR